MYMKKQTSLILFTTLIICFCFSIIFFKTDLAVPSSSSSGVFFKIGHQNLPYQEAVTPATPIIIIDPGHGGSDPGKISSTGTLEKDINLKIAQYLKFLLESQDIKVIMTRNEDKDLSAKSENRKAEDMKERLNLIQKTNADLFISIHQNSYSDPNVYGAQCFYHTDSHEGKKLASAIQKQIILSTNQTKIREIKENTDYYLLRYSTLPTVIVECGFLSSPNEEQLLVTKEYQRKLAWGIHLGILQYVKTGSVAK